MRRHEEGGNPPKRPWSKELWGNCLSNSLSFSPSGEMLAVSIEFGSTVSLFKFKELKLIGKWSRKPTGNYITRVRFRNEKEPVVSFGLPGVVEVLEMGLSLPKMTLRQELLKGESCGIFDFDFSISKKEVLCVGWHNYGAKLSHVLFKMKLGQGNEKQEWNHDAHEAETNAVRVSNCGSFVLSGGWDYELILTREKDGSVLKRQEDWFSH